MVHWKAFLVVAAVTLASCEPPVQGGYNYRRPSGFSAPQNQYLPPRSDYSAPPRDSYLPPPSFGHSGPQGFSQASNSQSGYEDHYDHGNDHGHGHENEVPKSYEFGYAVKDAQSGNDYNRHETSDGNVVRGEYRVQLPDGRTQIVTYHADWQTGFHADVRYEGEAHYPEPTHNNQQAAGYNYNSPTEFSGSLTGFNGNRGHRAPSTSYGAPSTSYVPPSTSYGAPSTAYGPPGYH